MVLTPVERFNNWIKAHPGDVERLILKAKTELGWTQERFWDFIDDLRNYAKTDHGAKNWAKRKGWKRTIDTNMFRQNKRNYGNKRERVSDIKGPSGPVELS